MNKAALTAAIAEKTGLTRKQAGDALDALVATVTEEVSKGEKVTIVGFGTFEVKFREARMGRNPQTREPSLIPAAWVPAFKPSKALRDLIDK